MKKKKELRKNREHRGSFQEEKSERERVPRGRTILVLPPFPQRARSSNRFDIARQKLIDELVHFSMLREIHGLKKSLQP